MIRAGRGGVLFDSFLEKSVVAVGWTATGNHIADPHPERMLPAFMATYPEASEQSNLVAARQVARFISEIAIGDFALTYSSERRVYALGRIESAARFDPTVIADGDKSWGNVRSVAWSVEIARDDLSQAARNTLGSILTLFLLRREVADEIVSLGRGEAKPRPAAPDDDGAPDAVAAPGMEEQSHELIKDRLARLSPDDMERFVAGLLRAMGYATKVSAPGADRGEDIRATPDALGLQDPRIVVEVKHRRGAIGAPELRAFLGGRHPGDKGLFVSTGGYTRDAHYEAARANIPLRLLSLNDLVELTIDHYEAMDLETRTMLPLKRLYWPLQ